MLNDLDITDGDSEFMIHEIINWFVCQINTIIRRKRIEILEKKPGAISGCITKVIYVHMIHRIGSFDSHTESVNNLRSKFNDALNFSAAKVKEHMLTINFCNRSEHFDKKGRLSENGQLAFFQEIDDLIQRLDLDKIKLLPAPYNQHKKSDWVYSTNRDQGYITTREYDAKKRSGASTSYDAKYCQLWNTHYDSSDNRENRYDCFECPSHQYYY